MGGLAWPICILFCIVTIIIFKRDFLSLAGWLNWLWIRGLGFGLFGRPLFSQKKEEEEVLLVFHHHHHFFFFVIFHPFSYIWPLIHAKRQEEFGDLDYLCMYLCVYYLPTYLPAVSLFVLEESLKHGYKEFGGRKERYLVE